MFYEISNVMCHSELINLWFKWANIHCIFYKMGDTPKNSLICMSIWGTGYMIIIAPLKFLLHGYMVKLAIIFTKLFSKRLDMCCVSVFLSWPLLSVLHLISVTDWYMLQRLICTTEKWCSTSGGYIWYFYYPY